jgi:cell division protein FtsB
MPLVPQPSLNVALAAPELVDYLDQLEQRRRMLKATMRKLHRQLVIEMLAHRVVALGIVLVAAFG